MGAIDERALEQLSFMSNLAELLHQKGQKQQRINLAEFFPTLIWVVRDFYLDLVNKNGMSITPKEYMQKALNQGSLELDSNNQIRKAITDNFRFMDCFTLVRPVESESQLRNIEDVPYQNLRKQFRVQLEELIKNVNYQIKPKLIQNSPINGEIFVQLIKDYCELLNTDQLPKITSIYERIIDNQFQRLIQQSIESFSSRVQDEIFYKLPLESEELIECLYELKSDIEQQYINNYKFSKVKREDARKIFQSKSKEIMRAIQQENQRRSFSECNSLTNQIINNILTFVVELKKTQFDFQKVQKELEKQITLFDDLKGPCKYSQLTTNFFPSFLKIIEQIIHSQEFQFISQETQLKEKLTQLQTQTETKINYLEEENNRIQQELEEQKAQQHGASEEIYQKLQESEQNALLLKGENTSLKSVMNTLTTNNLLPQPIPDINIAHELFFGINRPIECNKATEIYKQLAAHNNDSALTMLGALYIQGTKLPKDISSAIDCYLKVINLKSDNYQGEAYYRIGELVESNVLQFPVKFELPEINEVAKELFIKQCFEKAAESGHLDAITDLAGIYEHGSERIPKDLQKAEYWYQKAVQRQFPRGLNNFAKLLLSEKESFSTVKETYEVKAVECFQKAHELGYTKGTFNLGICYERGYFYPKNIEKAKMLFKIAADKGDVDAKMFYASYLLKDAVANGSEQQYLFAVEILQEIIRVDQSKLDAFYYLGYLYENGFGVAQDFKLSMNYYEKAAFNNNQPHALSLNKLGDIYNQGNQFVKQDRRIAYQYYKKAAGLNNKKALANFTQMYQEGFRDKNEINETQYINSLLEKQKEIQQQERSKQDAAGFVNNMILYNTQKNIKRK